MSAPCAILPRLQRDYWFSLAAATTIENFSGRIAAALQEKRIPWIALKGLLFARTLYPAQELRPMADVDFLVRGADMDAVGSLLAAQGYEWNVPRERRVTHEEMFERHYVRNAGAFRMEVEPHTGLGQAARYRVDIEGLWERSVPASHYGIAGWGSSARALSVEDNLAHLFLHQANAVFDEIDLRATIDLHELVCQWKPDWDRVLERARAWRVVVPMSIALGSARALFGTPVPERILAAIRPGILRRRWLDAFLDTGGLGLYRYAAHPNWLKRLAVGFPSMDRPLDALRYAAAYARLRLRDRRAASVAPPPSRRS